MIRLTLSPYFWRNKIKYYKYKLYKPTLKIYQRKAIDVLYENMIFYDEKGKKLFIDIREWLAKNDDKRGDLLAKMAKLMSECKTIAIECASKLAPYQSPKLESIEVNKKVTHRYVIQAPQQYNNSDQWLKAVNSPPKLIEDNSTHKPPVKHPRANGKSKEIIL